MSRPPTDLLPHIKEVVTIQDEFRTHFEWGLDHDQLSAKELISIVEDSGIDLWSRPNRAATVANIQRRAVLREQNVAILGAAIDVEELMQILETPTLLIVADGAAGVFSLLPDTSAERAWSRLLFMVSDADGGDGTIQAARRGKTIFLHAHGDNREDWKKLLDISIEASSPPPLVLTHQTPEEIPGMHNPGGFTDGDRAACIALSLGMPIDRITLLGTNTEEVGRWSGTTVGSTKLEKLKWMGRILRLLKLDF
ncbi:MAG: hypothetical protein VYA94_00300 [Candidatus Thermoplasmatota archaeon]|nr:hypothetical protein [Candidatus Thermoplasmatota archaeon]MEC9147110.1 hypothetical protein [Candidatus Thermoplasmatota archaeon]